MIRALALLLFLFPAFSAGAAEVKPADFAYGIPLKTSGMEAIYRFPLPREVYRGVTRGDMGDVCVFNAAGEVIPFAFSGVTPPSPAPSEYRDLPLFPVARVQGAGGSGLSLRVRRDGGGSIVSVETVEQAERKREIPAYLVDASSLKRPVEAFSLDWKPAPEGTAARVRVEGSDDLENWTVLTADAPVMALTYGGYTLERRTVELGSARMKYYRISSGNGSEMPPLSAIKARLAPPEPEIPRQWNRVTASGGKSGSGEYFFDLSGRMPVDRVRVMLPQENTLVTATFFSRAKESDPWRQNGSSLVYRLRIHGGEVVAPDIVLAPSSDRYRLMRIDPGGGGIGAGTPVIEFGWVPAGLLFVARGSGPYLLAYASARRTECGRSGGELFRLLADQRGERYRAGDAVPGPVITLGGKAALRPPLLPADSKNALLWAALLAGVAFLAWMAFRLHGQMKGKGDRSGH